MGLPKTKEEMIERGMTPLGLPGNEKRDAEIRAKTKGVTSEKASISAKIRRIKDGTTKVPDEAIRELITNPEASAAQIQEMIQLASKMDLKPAEFIQLVNVAIRKHSALFGTKMELEGNLKIQTTAGLVLDRLANWKRKEESEEPVVFDKPVLLVDESISTPTKGVDEQGNMYEIKQEVAGR